MKAKLKNHLFILILAICGLSLLGACKSSEQPKQAEVKPAESAIGDAEYIAKTVATGIEGLKNKYPHLASFSASEHLRKPHEGTTLYTIGYYNGVMGQKPQSKYGGKRSVEYIFDPETGVRLNVHFFTGDSRGCDAGLPQKRIGGLNIHLYIKGPEKDNIKVDIQEILDRLKSEYK